MSQATDPNQKFLVSELRTAIQTDEANGDQHEEKLVYLHYYQAMLQAVLDLQLCPQDAGKALTLLKARVNRLMRQAKNYIRTVDALPYERVQALFKETRTLFGDMKDLCADCLAALTRSILVNVRKHRAS
ncbi:hypothetical protein KSC_027550 [Ktedonobacter sp. SOSP1-52]|uniref:hypothetical protein n=1 Tax=Ktedonobacter sp. SOSP1-52 TaxID=2778366 RepID=UPI0019153F0A|nr:hypothetical protein [Ktedonobacter sp. SOSP1-52]GHO63863.1 hypothetical protein KSC_027550 [Ktedonobacter sp. SOSP1-52]